MTATVTSPVIDSEPLTVMTRSFYFKEFDSSPLPIDVGGFGANDYQRVENRALIPAELANPIELVATIVVRMKDLIEMSTEIPDDIRNAGDYIMFASHRGLDDISFADTTSYFAREATGTVSSASCECNADDETISI